MSGKMAIVGDAESITVFKAAGVEAFPAEDARKARETIRRVAKEHEVIFVTEELYKQLGDFLKRFDDAPYPVILCIPSKAGSTGYGDELLKEAMVRALGVDILFHND